MAFSENIKAHAEQAGSTLVHHSDLARRIAARHILKLTGPSDRMLRWRVGEVVPEGRGVHWALVSGDRQRAGIDPAEWPDRVVYAAQSDSERALNKGYRPAVAYYVGSKLMVGVQELPMYEDSFVKNFPDDPMVSDYRHMVGVVMRAGPGFKGAIGSTDQNGRSFAPFNSALTELPELDHGLIRV